MKFARFFVFVLFFLQTSHLAPLSALATASK